MCTHTQLTETPLNAPSISEYRNLFLFTDLQLGSPCGRGSPTNRSALPCSMKGPLLLCSCATFLFSMLQNTTVILRSITKQSKAKQTMLQKMGRMYRKGEKNFNNL